MKPNKSGGLDWLFHRSSGSVFGEQQTVEILMFDKDGILVGRDTEEDAADRHAARLARRGGHAASAAGSRGASAAPTAGA